MMNGKIHDKNTDFLFQAILALETPEECYRFFDDLCTVPELKAMSQRLAVAHMLSHKQVYSDIVAETGASTATISRVNRSLKLWQRWLRSGVPAAWTKRRARSEELFRFCPVLR